MSQTSGFNPMGFFTNLFGPKQPVSSAAFAPQGIPGQMTSLQSPIPAQMAQPQVQAQPQMAANAAVAQQTAGERMGFTDTGLGLGSMLGTLAAAIDPNGWGGRLGGGVAGMTQGEMSSRNSRDAQVAQRAHQLELMQALTQAIAGKNKGLEGISPLPSIVKDEQKMQ